MSAGYFKVLNVKFHLTSRQIFKTKYASHCFSESFYAVYTNIKIYRALYGIVLYLTYLCVTTIFILFAIIILQVKYIHSLHLTFIYFNYTLNYVFHGSRNNDSVVKSTCYTIMSLYPSTQVTSWVFCVCL